MAKAVPSYLQQSGEKLAGPLPPLLVAAERVAATVAQGVHGRRRVGQGETFWQFREYDVGDRPQSIDWRQTAKGDRIFVRQTEWEAAQSVWLWRDRSRSMSWASGGDLPQKRERADLLAMALVVLLIRGGEQVALLGDPAPPASGRAALRRLALTMDQQARDDRGEGGAGAGIPEGLDLPRHAQLVMIGDFLTPLEELSTAIERFAARGLRGHLLQVLDPAEETLPYQGRVRFEGLEDGDEPWLLSRVEAVRAAYLRRLRRQRFGLDDICRRAGWTISHHRTDQPAEMALLTLFRALADERGFF